MTNADRAFWVKPAIEAFQQETGTDDENAIADLVCDLCHAARARGDDPIEEVKRGLRHFLAEEADPPDGWSVEFDVEIIARARNA